MTEVYKLPKDRLYVTYFEGDTKNGLAADSEAKQYWLDQGLSEEHVIPGNAKDNFWGKLNGPYFLVCPELTPIAEMGAIGPCGPCR